MKFKYLLLVLAFVTTNAFALMSPQEIGKLIDSGQLAQAEDQLHAVLKVKDTAKVHYMLAQVYLRQKNMAAANQELETADRLDPAHSYTDITRYSQVANMIRGAVAEKRITVEAGPVKVISQPVQPSTPTNWGAVFGYTILLALIVGGAIFGFSFFKKRKETQETLDKKESELTEIKNGTLQLMPQLDAVILEAKTSANVVQEKVDALTKINKQVLNFYAELKDTKVTVDLDTNSLSQELRNLKRKYNDALMIEKGKPEVKAEVKLKINPTPAPEYHAGKAANAAASKVEGITTSKRSHIPMSKQAPAPTPTPTVVHETVVVNSSNSGLMDAILLNEVLESDRRRERDEERRAEERRAEERREREREQERSSSNWWGSGSDSGSDSWSSSRSSDSGSSSSWSSSSSSDSGSSSSWDSSSSSSSDSGSSSNDW